MGIQGPLFCAPGSGGRGKMWAESQLCLNCPGGPGVVPTSLARPQARPCTQPAASRTHLASWAPPAPASLRPCRVVTGHPAPGLCLLTGLENGKTLRRRRAARGISSRRQRADAREGLPVPTEQPPVQMARPGWNSLRLVTSDLGKPAHSHGTEGTTPPAWPQRGAEAPGVAGSGLEGRSVLRKEPSVQSPGQSVADAGRAGRASSQPAPTVHSQHFVQSLSSAHPF